MLQYYVQLCVVGADILIFSTCEASLIHALFGYFSNNGAGIGTSSDDDIAKEEVGDSSLEMQEEGEVERHDEVYQSCGKIFDDAFLFG